MNIDRQAYERQATEQMDAWQAQIDELRDNPGPVVDSRHGAQTELDKLQGQLEIARQQLLDMVAEENGDGWDLLRDGMEQKLEMLRSSFDDKTDDTVAV